MYIPIIIWGHLGRDRMVVKFTTTFAIGVYHRLKLWIQIQLRREVLSTTLCDKVCQWLATDRWFSQGTPIYTANKTDLHDITEILSKMALNTITLTLTQL
jgi:hypothetical protein